MRSRCECRACEDGSAGELDDAHQRDRDEIEEQTGDGHPAEQRRAHRHQYELGADRRRKNGDQGARDRGRQRRVQPRE